MNQSLDYLEQRALLLFEIADEIRDRHLSLISEDLRSVARRLKRQLDVLRESLHRGNQE